MTEHATLARGGALPELARRAWRLAEPIHGMVYFAPEAIERYAAIGLHGSRMGYFASRAAAFGPVGPNPVVATFYNFSPAVVARALPDAWSYADPGTVLAARHEAAGAALRRALGEAADAPEVAELAELAGRAARRAGDHVEGRPLFAAHAALPWPDEPLLALWHAQTLLREYRGDGHVAALLMEGLSGIEALVLHVATGEYPAEMMRGSRGWTEREWADTVADLATRGLVDAPTEGEPALTEAGRALRQRIEDRTDVLAAPAYAALGAEGTTRIGDLAGPLSRTIIAAGLLPGRA